MSKPKSKKYFYITREVIETYDFIECPTCGGQVPPWRVREILNSQIKFSELKTKKCPICRA